MRDRTGDTIFNLLVWAVVIFLVALYFRNRRRKLTSHGVAEWASDKLLEGWHMLGNYGLVLGRTLGGRLIRLPRYCHILLIGGTGSGKGIGIIIPNLFDYCRGSAVVFDTKKDLYQTTAGWRRYRKGQRIIRLDPFGHNDDKWNPLDTIPGNDPLLIDSAGAMAEALVVKDDTNDPHWNQKAAQVIKALLVLVLLSMKGAHRSLNSIQDIACDPSLLAAAADKLGELGGIPARLGNTIKALFDKGTALTKEGTGIMSTVARHLAFLDSPAVAKSVASSNCDVRSLLEPGTTLFLQIPPDQLEAQKGLLRCWVSTLIRVIGASGKEDNSEVLFILDEASALGGLAGIEEALVRGRSAGVRLLLAYQSDSQVRTAFKDKPTLIHDNCGTVIHMGPPGNYEDAERLSKSLGDWTQIVQSDGNNWGGSHSTGGNGGGSGSTSWGGSTNRAPQGRSLMRPEELLTLGEEYLIAFLRGFPAPILARRVKWFEDAAFVRLPTKQWELNGRLILWILIAVLSVAFGFLIVRAKVNGTGYWATERKWEVIDGKDR